MIWEMFAAGAVAVLLLCKSKPSLGLHWLSSQPEITMAFHQPLARYIQDMVGMPLTVFTAAIPTLALGAHGWCCCGASSTFCCR